MTADQTFLAALLHGNEDGALAGSGVDQLLDVYRGVCAALGVDDPADPLAARIARHLILLAAQGVTDPSILQARTIAAIKSG